MATVSCRETIAIIQALSNLDEVESVKSKSSIAEIQADNYREVRQLNIYKRNYNQRNNA